MFKKLPKINLLNAIYIIHIIVFGLVITGALPRDIITVLTVWLALYFALAKLEDSVAYFTRAIPFFVAIPFTADFDQFNMWRIFSAVIFMRWLYLDGFKSLWHGFLNFIKKPVIFLRKHRFIFVSGFLLFIAALSLTQAQDVVAGVKRIIYFTNLSLAGIVAYDLILKNKDFGKRIIKNIVPPVIIVTVAGFIQLGMTYTADIYGFMRIWGEGVECRLFGQEWCYIATWVGNTWFAYFGDQLSLRMFSIFPDSHSFPLFLVLGLPAVFAMAVFGVAKTAGEGLKKLFRTRARLSVLWIPTILLAIILSGTRGMWLAGAVTLIGAFIFARLFIKDRHLKNLFKYLASYLFIFVLLFTVAYPIFASPQFLVGKNSADLLGNRVRSLVDFGETSNKLRLEIWQKTFESIKKRPYLGVGIGNFPVVLNQDVRLARAGSSAHNLYLNIFAEMGFLAFVLALWFLWLLLKKTYINFKNSGNDAFMITYFAAALIFLVWGLLYLMTDIVLFDERAFLIFAIVAALTLGTKNNNPDSVKI